MIVELEGNPDACWNLRTVYALTWPRLLKRLQLSDAASIEGSSIILATTVRSLSSCKAKQRCVIICVLDTPADFYRQKTSLS